MLSNALAMKKEKANTETTELLESKEFLNFENAIKKLFEEEEKKPLEEIDKRRKKK